MPLPRCVSPHRLAGALCLAAAAVALAGLRLRLIGAGHGADPARRVVRRRRAREIARVLTRHGLGWIAGAGGPRQALPFHRGPLARTPRPATTRPQHVRLALQDLGPTFIKLGQIVSTRADLLPPDYQAELARLQDQAPSEPWTTVARVIDGELTGAGGVAAFAAIDPTPVAAASIGQAHAAVLPDGSEVIVKIRRPGVVERVDDDLAVLERVADAARHAVDRADRYDIPGLVRQFGATLRAELDYTAEAANAERFAANFARDPAVRIPRVFRDLSTAHVLTLERLRGAKVDDVAALDAAGIDRGALARRAATLVLQMVLRDGFFHTDPHPGNFFIAPDGRIGLIDFGMVGTLDDPARRALARALLAIAAGDPDTVVGALLDLGFAGPHADTPQLRHDLTALFRDQLDRPLGDISLADLLRRTFGIVRRHHLVMPANLALLAKTVAMHEGIGAQLDPDFRILDALSAFAATGSD